MTMISEEIPSVKGEVEYCLREYPATRDSDLILFYWVLKEFHSLDMPFEKFMAIFGAVHFESVRRIRQKFQEEDPQTYGPVNPEVARQRNRQAENLRVMTPKRIGDWA